MLSRRDIEKELGKGINIHPLYTENIKENSINLSVSTNCWTEDSATVYWDSNTFSINKPQQPKRTWDMKKGDNCIVDIGNSKHHNKQLLLLPHTTTIIETM